MGWQQFGESNSRFCYILETLNIKVRKIMKIKARSVAAIISVGLISFAMNGFAEGMKMKDGMMEKKSMDSMMMEKEKMEHKGMDGKMMDKKMAGDKTMADPMMEKKGMDDDMKTKMEKEM